MPPLSLNRTDILLVVIMVELSYPGVYIIEVPPALRAITAASTSTAAFIGMAEKGPVNEARRVTRFKRNKDTMV